jgi:hypothetical protein
MQKLRMPLCIFPLGLAALLLLSAYVQSLAQRYGVLFGYDSVHNNNADYSDSMSLKTLESREHPLKKTTFEMPCLDDWSFEASGAPAPQRPVLYICNNRA